MKDVCGKTLKLGDKVAASRTRGYAGLIVAEVIGFTPQKVRIVVYAYSKRDNVLDYAQLRDSDQVCIIEHNPIREAELTIPTTPSI